MFLSQRIATAIFEWLFRNGSKGEAMIYFVLTLGQ